MLSRFFTPATQLYDIPYIHTPTLVEWSTVTSEEVEKLIGAALNKTCKLDPAPTWLVKDMRRLLTVHPVAAQKVSHHWLLPAGV